MSARYRGQELKWELGQNLRSSYQQEPSQEESRFCYAPPSQLEFAKIQEILY
jgi:hypothetical protein